MRRWFLLGCGVACFTISIVSFRGVYADTLELRGGGVLTGKLLGKKDTGNYKLRTYDGLDIEIERKQVIKVTPTDEERLKAYVESVNSASDDLEGNKAIVDECLSRQQKSLANAHRERVVELDPEDKVTWAALDYNFDSAQKKWVRRDRLQIERGMVKHNGKWVSWYDKLFLESQEKEDRTRADLNKQISINVKHIEEGGRQAPNAQAFFSNLNNPLAIPKIFELYSEARNENRNASMYLAVLMRMPDYSVTTTIIRIAMEDRDTAIVDQCLEWLMRSEATRDAAIQAFMAELRSGKIDRVNRAGYALGGVGDERAWYALINSLVSKKVVVQGSGGGGLGGAAFNSQGGVQMNQGGAKAVESTVPNQQVHATLCQQTGQNFQYNIDEWKIWFANHFAITNMDLRRDEF